MVLIKYWVKPYTKYYGLIPIKVRGHYRNFDLIDGRLKRYNPPKTKDVPVTFTKKDGSKLTFIGKSAL